MPDEFAAKPWGQAWVAMFDADGFVLSEEVQEVGDGFLLEEGSAEGLGGMEELVLRHGSEL